MALFRHVQELPHAYVNELLMFVLQPRQSALLRDLAELGERGGGCRRRVALGPESCRAQPTKEPAFAVDLLSPSGTMEAPEIWRNQPPNMLGPSASGTMDAPEICRIQFSAEGPPPDGIGSAAMLAPEICRIQDKAETPPVAAPGRDSSRAIDAPDICRAQSKTPGLPLALASSCCGGMAANVIFADRAPRQHDSQAQPNLRAVWPSRRGLRLSRHRSSKQAPHS